MSPLGRRRLSGLLATACTIATLAAVAWLGHAQEGRGERVLAQLAPFVSWLLSAGNTFLAALLSNLSLLGRIITSLAVAIAVAATLLRGRRAAPLWLLAAAVSLASWGQISLLQDQVGRGVRLYLAGCACALALGLFWPLSRIAAEGRNGAPAPPGGSGVAGPRRAWERGLVAAVTVVAFVLRFYALSELPASFEGEMIVAMLASRTLAGLYEYIPWAITSNSNGLVHLFPQMLSLQVFGTSIFALRFVAVVLGTMAVPLFYGLLRKLVAVGPAVFGTVLLATAPEQLYWSRAENTIYAAIPVLAIVTVRIGIWMVPRLPFAAVLAAALWMPFTRYFYTAGAVMMLYPLALCVHAALFVRGAWRRLWFALPVLGIGFCLWVFTLSFAGWTFSGSSWRFINPAVSGGVPVWRGEGQFRDTHWADLVRLQVSATGDKLVRVATAMTYRTGFTTWYKRSDPSSHPTLISVGVVITFALALSYLVPQARAPSAFALLLCFVLGLLPGILSLDPAPRRMSVIFPAMYAIIAVFVDAVLRLARTRGGRIVGYVVAATGAVALAGLTSVNLTSHFGLPVVRLPQEDLFAFGRPLFERSDAIYHDANPSLELLLLFGGADEFLGRQTPPCYDYVMPRRWVRVATQLPCDFTRAPFRFTLPRERRAELQASYDPRRITFLLVDRRRSADTEEVLKALFPDAAVSSLRWEWAHDLVAYTVDVSAVERLRKPLVCTSPDIDVERRLLDGVELRREDASSPACRGQTGVSVDGGILLERDGWYRVRPSCPAEVKLDGHPVTADEHPLLAGLHRFELKLADGLACPLPMHFKVEARDAAGKARVEAPVLLSPELTVQSNLRAAPVQTYAGYEPAQPVPTGSGAPQDYDVEDDGMLTLLIRDDAEFRVRRLKRNGAEVFDWPIVPQEGLIFSALEVSPDGSIYVFAVEVVGGYQHLMRFDRTGKLLGRWPDGDLWSGPDDIAFLADGRRLRAVPGRASVAVFDSTGGLESEWKKFDGGPGVFDAPVVARTSPGGDILVIQDNGLALLFENRHGGFAPRFAAAFQIDFTWPSTSPRGAAFDGADRIVVPDPTAPKTMVYAIDGTRMMAREPQRDIESQFAGGTRYREAAGRLYVLDGNRKLWMLSRAG